MLSKRHGKSQGKAKGNKAKGGTAPPKMKASAISKERKLLKERKKVKLERKIKKRGGALVKTSKKASKKGK